MAAKTRIEEQSRHPQEAVSEQTPTKRLAYWKKHLAFAPTGIDLPTDHQRPAAPSARLARHNFTLPASLCDSLQDVSLQEDAALLTTLLAAFAALLYRYTGQEDLVVGAAHTGQFSSETRHVPETFITPLPLRLDLSDNPGFRTLLRRARERMASALAHSLPLEQLASELQPEATGGQNPLFQVLVTLESGATGAPDFWSGLSSAAPVEAATVDLALSLAASPADFCGQLAYRPDLFEAATIERMVGHWQSLLEGIVANPDQPISSLPLLTAAERTRTLEEWNATKTPYPQDRCVQQLFEQQVARTPEAVAVVYADRQLTYRELNQRANQLAHYLRSLGVGPEVLVGLCIERSVEMVVGLLGILKAGGAYVPLDPAFPADRLAFMLEDAQVPVLVTQASLLNRLPPHSGRVVCLDSDSGVLAQHSDENPLPRATQENLAYVMYTSGSTGRPKGVQILQRALVNFLLSMRQEPGLTAEDTLLAVTTLSFDIAALELFLPLIVGARVIVVSHDTAANGQALMRALTDSRATVMQATPVTWRILLAGAWEHNPSLKILCGGEALPLELARQLLQKGGSLWNLYGPTETTVWSTARKIEADDRVISIGRPIANTEIYLLDAHLQPVPIGVPGELYIGGDGLARGYLNRPELTAERFIPHPFSAEPGARLYRTGDLARYLPNGEIEHLGRIDHQVKIRGFRIELGEIEIALRQHPAVREAVVVAREDTPGEKRLVAYIVPIAGAELSTASLRETLAAQLPNYMLPAAFVSLGALPLTPNNKVDRRALPAPEETSIELGEEYVAPRTEIEERLAATWAELLRVKRVGITNNFFELGGHSLLATQLLLKVQEQFQVEVPLSSFFETPTIRDLSAQIEQLLIAKIEMMSDEEVQRLLG